MTTTTTTRPAPPPIIWQAPLCPLCDAEVECDGDSLACTNCEAHWSVTGNDDGEWYADDEPQCAATGASRGGDAEQCLKSENHVDSPSQEVRAHASASYQWGEGIDSWHGVEVTPPAPKDERDARTAERHADYVRRRAEDDAKANEARQALVERWNATYPVGTPVRYWPHGLGCIRGGVGETDGVTTSPARRDGDGHWAGIVIDLAGVEQPVSLWTITTPAVHR